MALIKCSKCGKEISDKATICPNCSCSIIIGNEHNSYENDNVFEEKKSKTGVKFYKKWWFWVIIILLAIIGCTDDTENNTNNLIENDIVNSINVVSTNNNNNINIASETDISNFEYSVNGTTIKLTRYKGKDTTVKIADTYTIDNITYTVTELENSIFNSTGVNTLFIPKTIISITDKLLAYITPNDDTNKVNIYFEGSENDWNNIFSIYQASSVSEEWAQNNAYGAGVALADKINSMIGSKYDSNKFVYHYNATMQDIEY